MLGMLRKSCIENSISTSRFLFNFTVVTLYFTARRKLLRKPLQKIVTGGILLSLAFVASAIVENELVKEDSVTLSAIPPEESRIMVINGDPDPRCKIEFKVNANEWIDERYELNFNQSKSP